MKGSLAHEELGWKNLKVGSDEGLDGMLGGFNFYLEHWCSHWGNEETNWLSRNCFNIGIGQFHWNQKKNMLRHFEDLWFPKVCHSSNLGLRPPQKTKPPWRFTTFNAARNESNVGWMLGDPALLGEMEMELKIEGHYDLSQGVPRH